MEAVGVKTPTEYVARMGEHFLGGEAIVGRGKPAGPARHQGDAAPVSVRKGYLTAIGLPGEPVAPLRRSGE